MTAGERPGVSQDPDTPTGAADGRVTVLLALSTACLVATCLVLALSHTPWIELAAIYVLLPAWAVLAFAAGVIEIDAYFDRRARELGLPPKDPS